MNNLLLIKSAKAIKALRRDGISAVFRIIDAIIKTFKPIGSGDCLIITGGVGDSARYRGFHVAEELTLNGIKTKVAFQDNPFLFGKVKDFEHFIFHRSLYTPQIKKILAEITTQNKTFSFDTDDLVFDKKHLKHMDYFQKMNKFEKKLYENGVGKEILTHPNLAFCTTTTDYLAEKLAKFTPTVHKIENKLSLKDKKVVDKVFAKFNRNDKIITLGYFSGTASHNKDFATITEPLLYILKKHANVNLLIAGPLDTDPRFGAFKSQIIRKKFTNRKNHFCNISKIDINLAPLEINNPFCESKSELKFFEAGILKVPTIASATKSFEFIENGITGFKAERKKDWSHFIEKLINDHTLRKSIGNNAQKLVQSKYVNKKMEGDPFFNFIKI
jgi:O-antigen biosynthesis protein